MKSDYTPLVEEYIVVRAVSLVFNYVVNSHHFWGGVHKSVLFAKISDYRPQRPVFMRVCEDGSIPAGDATDMSNERTTDQFVRDMLRDIGFPRPWEQSCSDAPKYIYDALEGASKGLGGGRGKPEFVVESGDFLIVVEDKASVGHSARLVGGVIDVSYPARCEYALNGATHYARIFAERTGKKVFAVGVAGSEAHYEITVAFIEKKFSSQRTGFSRYVDRPGG